MTGDGAIHLTGLHSRMGAMLLTPVSVGTRAYVMADKAVASNILPKTESRKVLCHIPRWDPGKKLTQGTLYTP